MSNNSTPRIGIATVRSAVNAMNYKLEEGQRPSELQIQHAVTSLIAASRKEGKRLKHKPAQIHRDGRFYAAWAPMPNSKRRSAADQALAALSKRQIEARERGHGRA